MEPQAQRKSRNEPKSPVQIQHKHKILFRADRVIEVRRHVEVIAGLNPRETDMMIDLIRQLRESGITIFMVEHVMRAVLSVSDRIVVLNFGEKIAEGTPDEVATNSHVVEAYLGKVYAEEWKNNNNKTRNGVIPDKANQQNNLLCSK